MMGDSLSDRGTMGGRKLLYFIPMAGLSGLGKSPKKRFTNGYNWADELAAFVSEDGIITKLERRGQRSDDIADDIIDHDPRVEKPLQTYFNLDDDRFVNYRGQDYIRSYDEGGLTAYDYSTRITFNLKLLAEDQILATLDEKRHLMLGDDKARGISAEHKKKTMVIEWSGANDLVTINDKETSSGSDPYYDSASKKNKQSNGTRRRSTFKR